MYPGLQWGRTSSPPKHPTITQEPFLGQAVGIDPQCWGRLEEWCACQAPLPFHPPTPHNPPPPEEQMAPAWAGGGDGELAFVYVCGFLKI